MRLLCDIWDYLGSFDNMGNITGTLQECKNTVESLLMEIWSVNDGKCDKFTTLVNE